MVKQGYNVEEVVVYLGELQNADREVIESYLKRLAPEIAPGVRVRSEVEKARFRCRVCGSEWSLQDLDLDEDIREAVHFVPEAIYSFAKCPRCGSRDFEIVSGRGVRLSLKVSRGEG
ncbi:hydrogenase expression/synthesis HypA [Pyrolobus fumarii 1A]|uniref:Hydrogenase expression/synthesis HypA n=1 Tax=Pyrolobus fumarii (strain DSM 11204 / 1A) TaxID=694429 RepID=G0EF76_PYRF1|nr:hydrogenase expression/synthesis HypA [Pyrolobus fumarii 1A]